MYFKFSLETSVSRRWLIRWIPLLWLTVTIETVTAQAITDFRTGQVVVQIVQRQNDSVLVRETVSGEYPQLRWYKFFKNQQNDSDDSLLFASIASMRVIENLFIESLNLERIERINAVRRRLNLAVPFRMRHCIVYNAVAPRRDPDQQYERQFSKSLSIEHCIFRNGLDLSGGIFIDSVRIEDSHFNGIDFSGGTFFKPVVIKRVSVSNQLNFKKVEMKRSVQDAAVQPYGSITECYLNDVEMGDAVFKVPVFFNGTFFGSRLSVYHTQFLRGADLSGVSFDNSMNLNGATFKKFIRLRNIRFHENDTDRGRSLMSGIALFQNADLTDSISGDENIVNYNLNLVSLKQVWFDLSTFNFNEAERLLSSLIQNVNANSNAPEELRNEALARLKYQLIQLQRTNPETPWLDKTVLDILQVVVRNGYKGGGQFFFTSLLIVAIFSLIYQSRFMADVSVMVKGDRLKPDARDSKASLLSKVSGLFLSRVLEFFEAMWFSVYIFLSPKFPSEIFKRSPVFQLIATVEWVFGVGMIIVYFVYIASNYAFIRSLLGI